MANRVPSIPSTNWALVWVGFATGCIVSFNIGKVPAALPAMSIELGLDVVAASELVSVFSLLSAVCGFVLALLGIWLGGRVTVLLGLLCCFVAGLVGALTDSFPVLLASRAVEGVGWLIVAVSMPALLNSISTPSDRPLVLGLWGAFVPVGMTAALLISPAMIENLGWQSLWMLSGFLSLFWVIVFYGSYCWGYSPTVVEKPGFSDMLAGVAYLPPWFMAICFLAYSALFIVVTAFLPTLLLQRFEINLEVAAMLSAVVVIANGVGNIASGPLRRCGYHFSSILIVAFAVMGVTAIMLYSGRLSLNLAIAAAVVSCGFGGLIPGTLFGATAEVARKSFHAFFSVGLMMQCAGLGQLLAPLALGKTVDSSGDWASVVWLNLALMLIGLAAALVLYNRLNRAAPQAWA